MTQTTKASFTGVPFPPPQATSKPEAVTTANTKLSLPVLVDLACALGVRTDNLIFDKDTLGKDELLEEITLELDGCSKEQLLALRQILSSSKEAIQKYLER